MSNIVQLNKQVESTTSNHKPDLDENLKIIVRQLARQAAKEYFESYQALESKQAANQNSTVDRVDSEGV